MTEYEKLMATANQCGIKVISDDWCCCLLAWLYVYGGGNEATVYNSNLRVDIEEAQRRLNIFGGEVPKKELCQKMSDYIFGLQNHTTGIDAVICDEIKERYGVKTIG
ncbi:MAG: hypothetical protein Q4F84_01135 [Fibrobacter sp.]|nr:hypothetical protein [Fibrobacter sp.]